MFETLELSDLPSREASPAPSTNAPLSEAGTESTTGTDPGDTQSVYRPPTGSQTLQLPPANRPKRTKARKRTSTQARLSISTITFPDFNVAWLTINSLIELWNSSIAPISTP